MEGVFLTLAPEVIFVPEKKGILTNVSQVFDNQSENPKSFILISNL
jgi:hypothetical protein